MSKVEVKVNELRIRYSREIGAWLVSIEKEDGNMVNAEAGTIEIKPSAYESIYKILMRDDRVIRVTTDVDKTLTVRLFPGPFKKQGMLVEG